MEAARLKPPLLALLLGPTAERAEEDGAGAGADTAGRAAARCAVTGTRADV
jgi:hypothetical protein